MRNNTLITLLLSVFIALLGIGIIIPVMPVFAKELGAGGLALGMIIAAFSITRGLLQPVIGNLSDTWDKKNFLMSGLLVYGLVGLLIPQASSVDHLIIIRAFHGVGSAMIVPIGMAYMSFLAPEGREGQYMSYLNIAIFSGIGCGPIIGGVLFDSMGMSSVFYSMAGLSFVALVLVIINMPGGIRSTKTGKPRLLSSMAAMLRNSKTMGILLARYATMLIMVPTMAFLPILMSTWETTTGVQIGIVIACRTLVSAVLQVPFGKIADKYNKLVLLLSSSLAVATVLALIPQVDTFFWMAVTYTALGTVEAVVWSVLGAYASLEAKARYGHGTMMGIFSFAMSAGVLTGSLLAGVSMDTWGISAAYYMTATTVAVLSLLAALLIFRGEGKRETEEKG